MLVPNMVDGFLEGELFLGQDHFQDFNSILEGDQGGLGSKGLFELK